MSVIGMEGLQDEGRWPQSAPPAALAGAAPGGDPWELPAVLSADGDPEDNGGSGGGGSSHSGSGSWSSADGYADNERRAQGQPLAARSLWMPPDQQYWPWSADDSESEGEAGSYLGSSDDMDFGARFSSSSWQSVPTVVYDSIAVDTDSGGETAGSYVKHQWAAARPVPADARVAAHHAAAASAYAATLQSHGQHFLATNSLPRTELRPVAQLIKDFIEAVESRERKSSAARENVWKLASALLKEEQHAFESRPKAFEGEWGVFREAPKQRRPYNIGRDKWQNSGGKKGSTLWTANTDVGIMRCCYGKVTRVHGDDLRYHEYSFTPESKEPAHVLDRRLFVCLGSLK